jgi:hypothetical protein
MLRVKAEVLESLTEPISPPTFSYEPFSKMLIVAAIHGIVLTEMAKQKVIHNRVLFIFLPLPKYSEIKTTALSVRDGNF